MFFLEEECRVDSRMLWKLLFECPLWVSWNSDILIVYGLNGVISITSRIWIFWTFGHNSLRFFCGKKICLRVLWIGSLWTIKKSGQITHFTQNLEKISPRIIYPYILAVGSQSFAKTLTKCQDSFCWAYECQLNLAAITDFCCTWVTVLFMSVY